MADQISLGKNGNIGKINLSRIKAGVKKEELAKNDARLESVFDMIDKNKDGVLDRRELDDLQKNVRNQAGEDNNLKKKEVKNFDGQKLKRKERKELLEFLNKLDGVTPEDVEKVETKLVDNEQVEVVTYKDGHTDEYYPNGQRISEIVSGNKKTKTTEINGAVTSEVVTENEGEENEIISTTSIVNSQKQTVINNKGDKTTTTINYNGDIKSDATIVGENSTTVITYDSEGNPAKEVETSGTTEKTYIYQNDQKVLQKSIENKGLVGKETSKVYDSQGGYTQTQEVGTGKITTVVDKEGNVTSNVKTEKVNGQEVSLQLDKDGNIPGVIVQNGETPTDIAKKFGCSADELVQLNADQLKGKGKNQYFAVGSEIKLPGSVSVEKFNKASEGRKSAEIAKQEYAHDAEIRRQKAEEKRLKDQETAILKKEFGLKERVPEKEIDVKLQKGETIKLTKIGNGEYGRQICVGKGGRIFVVSKDNTLLRSDYIQAHKAYVNNQKSKTVSSINNVTYVKDNNGKVWYFDEKTGKAIVKEDYTQIVKQESAFVAGQLHQAATKSLGTDEELLEQGVKNIYSRDILQGVNTELKSKDSDYAGDAQTMPVEALILDEMSHTAARPLFKTLINSGTMTTQEQAHTVKREIEYEVHGGLTGYTSTSDLNEIMQLCSDRDLRLEVEAQFKKDYPELAGNNDSVVRSYIAGDGWNAQEVDQFDANWVKTGAYQEARYVYQTDENGNVVLDKNGQPVVVIDEGDQAHRNGVIGRLVFDYQDKEALNKGLDAVNENPNSFDYQYLDQRAGEEIKKDPQSKYQSRFTNQDNFQRYLAGFHSDKSGNVDAGNVSASNTCLFKGIKPARVQAEEALYNAKNGDYSKTFDSMDADTYSAISEIIASGDIKGVKNMTDLYNKALNSATSTDDKIKIKANAMLSGQVDFTNDEMTDFCIGLMHSIDTNTGSGKSVNHSAGDLNIADYQTEQLKAILQNNPQIMDAVKSRVEKENFTKTTAKATTMGPGIVNFESVDTKDKYTKLLADTKTIAKEEVFYDASGKKITDTEQIEIIKNANMQSLEQMRQYVSELERDFKKGVDAEGTLSDMANGLSENSGLGTDRQDVANQYRNAKLMLQQFEAAAQGKLRDSEGHVISAQDLAQQMMDKQNALSETNSDYKQTIAYGKMGIVLAPVIVATTVASGGAAAAGWGTAGIAAAGGTAAGAATYGINALEYNTSYTGNTAEAREQNLEDSLVNGAATAIGIGQMKPIMGMANSMGTAARTGIRLGTTVAADTAVGAAAEGITTGDVTAQGIATNMIMSGVGNIIGAKTLGQKQAASGLAHESAYGNTFKHQNTAGGEKTNAHNSNVHVKTEKGAEKINSKTDKLVKSSTNGTELGNAHNELDALSNRETRRANQAKINEKVKTLSSEEKAKFNETIRQHHKAETEHVFERHNELSETDFRTVGNSIKDAQTPSDLIALRKDLKNKEYSQGGVTAEYKALEKEIDGKLTNMIRNGGADDLETISKELAEIKSQVPNDKRLNSSLDNLNKEIQTRSAYLKDQKSAVEGILTNSKGIADNNELNKITSYIKTLDSEEALQRIDFLRRGKKMTGAQKKALDTAINEKSAKLKQTKNSAQRAAAERPVANQAAKTPELETARKPYQAPELFETSANGGFFDMFKTKYKTEVDANITQVKNSVKVTRFPETFNLKDITKSNIKDGGTFSVGDKLYIRSGNEAIKLDISPATYERLFPTEIASFNQGASNSCWFLSTIDNALDSPQGKLSVLKMFSEDAKGNIYVTSTAKGTNSIMFPNGKPLNIKNGVKGSDGVAMLEQAMAYHQIEYDKFGPHTAHKNDIGNLEFKIGNKNFMSNPAIAFKYLGGNSSLKGSNIQAPISGFSTSEQVAKYKHDFAETMRSVGSDPNLKVQVAYEGHQRAVKGYQKIDDIEYVILSDPYRAGNFEKIELNKLLNKNASATIGKFGEATPSAVVSQKSPTPASYNVKVDNSVSSEISVKPQVTISEIQKHRYVIGEEKSTAIHQTEGVSVLRRKSQPTAEIQRTRISSADLKTIITADGKNVKVRTLGSSSIDSQSVEINGKKYDVKLGEKLRILDDLTLSCNKFGMVYLESKPAFEL